MILILNGPNLNLLGSREPEVYGKTTLKDLEQACEQWALSLGLKVECKQSNHEGQLIDWIHEAKLKATQGIIINAGGYTHSSIALRDAISGVAIPSIEVHISNIHARETFRHHSYLAAVCLGSIVGLGIDGYHAALLKFANLLAESKTQ